jgi:predicted adenine nucleotide alpha hydrolase (AANH) superfamily ATPase
LSKLLLHTCCGPCTIAVYEKLKGQDFDLTGFFYNPNIQPFEEYERRLLTLARYAATVELKVVYDKAEPQHLAASSCYDCYRTRLQATAQKAVELGYGLFSTTLLISPYQQHDLIKQLGEGIGSEFGVKFFYQDFRPLFRAGQKRAREMKLYMQKYCGCGAKPSSSGILKM